MLLDNGLRLDLANKLPHGKQSLQKICSFQIILLVWLISEVGEHYRLSTVIWTKPVLTNTLFNLPSFPGASVKHNTMLTDVLD